MKHAITLTGLMLLVGGCRSLPPGDAPTGPIVAPKVYPETFPVQGAENYFITALATYCLSELPAGTPVGNRFSSTDAVPARHPRRVLDAVRRTAQLAVVQEESKAAYIIESSTDDSEPVHWEMRLIRRQDQRIVWSARVTIEPPSR